MKRLRLLSLCLALALLAGCTPTASLHAGPTPEPTPVPTQPQSTHTPTPAAPVEIQPLSAEGCVELPVLTPDAENYRAYTAFALELLQAAREEGNNTLLSPLSVALALGMTANGAGGSTLSEFEALFGMDLNALNALCWAMLGDYSELGGSTETTLVNSLWADPDLELKLPFLLTCQDYYGAPLFQASLQDSATVKAINAWVSEPPRG